MDISELRSEIDKIDENLVDLFVKIGYNYNVLGENGS